MTEWHALKVTELKEELKARGVALTGLKLKQQLVDKLVEIDAEAASSAAPSNEKSEIEEGKDGDGDDENIAEQQSESASASNSHDKTENHDREAKDPEQPPEEITKEENSSDNRAPEPIEVEGQRASQRVLQDDPFLPETVIESHKPTKEEDDNAPETGTKQTEPQADPEKDLESVPEQSGNPSWRRGTSKSDLETVTSTRVPTPDILDDQRKRKRRSASPPPDSQDVSRKKSKVEGESTAEGEREADALRRIQAATAQAEISRQPNDSVEEEVLRPMEASEDVAAMRVAKEVGSLPDAPELNTTGPRDDLSPTPIPKIQTEKEIAPARHRVTQSLYIRNFKRPLHIPTLRSHISILARSAESEEDQVKIFYLDNIRTHAFISFKSKAAAIQVRNAMHEKRFPDEPMREPLWVDFIPDDRVQAWIDEESRSGEGGFGGSRSGRKFEIRYEDTSNGVTASLHDGTSAPNQRSIPIQQRAIQYERNAAEPTAPRVHPERAAFVRQEPKKSSYPTQKSDVGKGFKALDELFDSTTTKPKLYYKVPERSIVDARLDMVNTLRVGHGEMGKSGDEGMKRYTFENYKGREDWVDKGPEFGFGRRGQDRLAGFRGRGGPHRGSRRGGGDSWRGR